MLLLVDAGNSRIKWALADPAANGSLGAWADSGSVETGKVAQLGQIWRDKAGSDFAGAPGPASRVLVSNVAGPGLRAELERTLQAAFGTDLPLVTWFASAASAGGVRNAYRNPAQLGCDRLAAAIGAHALFPRQALIVASCGTATTIDALTPEGVFLGGMILPGLALMARSLASNTAQLPLVAQNVTVAMPFADNTDDAIISGCIAAQAGAIERALAAHASAQSGVRCVLSGGAAAAIAPHLSAGCSRVENLVLVGLQVLALQQ